MTTSGPNPTWYDILGVAPDATADEVKAAWRLATDKFEPGSGTSQFRLFNEAADVLLDPERRAAYDAELAAREPGPEPEPPVPAPPADLPPTVEPGKADRHGRDFLGRFAAVPTLVLAILAVVTTAAIVVAVLYGLRLHERVQVFEAGPDATAAAERALTSVLSYDYRHMEADRDRAAQFLTPSYRKEYVKNFDDLLTKGPDGAPGPAEKTKAVVSADVLDSAVVDADTDRVRVVVFVNQSSVKGDAQPTIFQNRVVATMVRRDGSWLLDNIKSY